jgi:NAD(P)-dependent dehydrogenase (short-subunit alcohol dehydrogenase family)
MRFTGKVVIVTGAARGQGRESALAFASEGASLAVTDVLVDDLRRTGTLISEAGGQVVSVAGDLTDPDTIAALVSGASGAFGGIDMLHNNAGVLIGGTLEETSVSDFERAFRVNCVTQLLTLQAVVPHMRRRGGGAIVNTSSICGLAAVDHMGAYGATKAAINSLTRSAAREFAPDNIRVNAVCPGGVDTPMAAAAKQMFASEAEFIEFATSRQLVKKFAQSSDIIPTVLFLASDAAALITGASIPVEGGHMAW